MSKRRGAPVPQEDISPNVIPMIDIMFLLLLFLMVAADMGAREYEEVKLPIAKDIKEDKEEKLKDKRLTVNVFHVYERDLRCDAFSGGDVCIDETHWKIGIKGQEYTRDGVKDFLKARADEKRPPNDLSAPSELRVMIRADQAALYGFVQKVMNGCALAGIYKIEFGAAEEVK